MASFRFYHKLSLLAEKECENDKVETVNHIKLCRLASDHADEWYKQKSEIDRENKVRFFGTLKF